jgi:ferredoxin
MINSFFKSKYFVLAFQFITLIVFILLIYGGIGITTNDPDFAKILRNTNLPNLIVWSYWWPFIIVSSILFGRYWCTICPMELVTSFFGRMGLKKKPGKFLKSGWISTLFYAMILVLGIHTLAIHRIPQYMAIYMLILFALAVIVGLIWEKRTFCTHVCPIGHIIGLYSLLSASKLRVKDEDVCKSCKTKDCISNKSHYKLVARSCTSELFPPKLSDNRDCILCGQCFNSCSKDNIAIQKRGIAEDLFKKLDFKWAEIAIFMIVSSFVVYEILSEWSASKAYIMALPNWINNSLNISGGLKGTIKAVSLFFILPSIFYFVFAWLKKTFAKESWKTALSQLVIAVLPITASVHLLKATLKTTSRIPYWQYVFSDPEGVETATKIMQDKSLLHSDILTNIISPSINYIAVLLPVLGFILSLYVIKKQKHNNSVSKAISVLAVVLYAGIFIVTIVGWKWL